MKSKRKTLLWITLVGIALLAFFFLRSRHAGRVYNAARWRLAAAGISLPPLQPSGPRSGPDQLIASDKAEGERQLLMTKEEQQVLLKLPGWGPDGDPLPVQPELLAPLPEPFPKLLVPMHQRKPQTGIDGAMHPLSLAGVMPQDGMYIYELCKSVRPTRTLEVGFAEGLSTMYFLAAVKSNGKGSHVAIDPFEISQWHGLGLRKVQEAGMADRFRFMEAFSVSALPLLASEGLKFDVIFIDGDHRYDTQLVDFVLSDVVSPKGGYILLHDVHLRSTRKLISFIERNRADYKRHPTGVNMAAFQKTGEDRREWFHFVDF